jgi:prophage regulatory protein
MLNSRQVIQLTDLSLSTIKRMLGDGRFPKPMHLSPRRIGWPAHEIKAWLKRLDEQRYATLQ